MKCRALAGLVVTAGCVALPPEEPEVYRVGRIEDRVTVSGRAGPAILIDADVSLEGDRVVASYRDADGRQVRVEIEVQARSIVRPAARVDDGSRILELTGPIVDGEPRWIAELDGQRFDVGVPADQAALIEALQTTEMHDAFLALLPFRDEVRAHMAETRTLFELFDIVDPDRSVTPHLDEDDLSPPGMLPGDTPALGMTCSTAIKCPGSAPYCVTRDHEEERGVCLRTCIDDLDCAVPGGGGRCGVDVVDIPDVSGVLRMCDLTCSATACPGLLTCEGGQCVAPPG